jgi:hypothetical protein
LSLSHPFRKTFILIKNRCYYLSGGIKMKFKRIVPLCASLLMLAACSTGGSSSAQPSSEAAPSEPSSIVQTVKLTTIDPGKMYIDINFENKPEDFAIKVGSEVITETKTITPTAESVFTVEGALNNISIYYAVEYRSATNAGILENVDEEAALTKAKGVLERLAKLNSETRIYVVITDKVGGWSKPVPGVNDIITSRINNSFGF